MASVVWASIASRDSIAKQRERTRPDAIKAIPRQKLTLGNRKTQLETVFECYEAERERDSRTLVCLLVVRET